MLFAPRRRHPRAADARCRLCLARCLEMLRGVLCAPVAAASHSCRRRTHSRAVTPAELKAVLEGLGVGGRERIAVAVSGGVDSMALSYLLSVAYPPSKVVAITVDHGIRPESADEAKKVASVLERLGIRDHRIMKVAWDTRDDSCGDAEREMRDGPSEALRIRPAQIEILGRRKRYALLAQACKASNIKYLVTAHHADDQAETVLYRFARGSLAIQGLAGMHPMAGVPVRVPGSVGLRVVRPLLEYNKSRLIETCRAANIPWFEDTTNADLRHARNNIRSFFSEIKQRKLDLTGEGDHDDRSLAPLSSASWVALANRMADHQRKLKERVLDVLRNDIQFSTTNGFCSFTVPAHTSCGNESHWSYDPVLAKRVLAVIARWVSPAENIDSTDNIAMAIRHGGPATTVSSVCFVPTPLMAPSPGDRWKVSGNPANIAGVKWVAARAPLPKAHHGHRPVEVDIGVVLQVDPSTLTGLEARVPESAEEVMWDNRFAVSLRFSSPRAFSGLPQKADSRSPGISTAADATLATKFCNATTSLPPPACPQFVVRALMPADVRKLKKTLTGPEWGLLAEFRRSYPRFQKRPYMIPAVVALWPSTAGEQPASGRAGEERKPREVLVSVPTLAIQLEPNLCTATANHWMTNYLSVEFEVFREDILQERQRKSLEAPLPRQLIDVQYC